jgi:hypothetical protein
MNDETEIKFFDDHEARMRIRFTDGVAMLVFDIGQLRWAQLPPAKMRESQRRSTRQPDKVPRPQRERSYPGGRRAHACAA